MEGINEPESPQTDSNGHPLSIKTLHLQPTGNTTLPSITITALILVPHLYFRKYCQLSVPRNIQGDAKIQQLVRQTFLEDASEQCGAFPTQT